MAFEEIYKRLMENALLIEAHEKELIDKRGFSQETIRKFRFGSGGPHLVEFEASELKSLADEKVREQDLVGSGVFIHDGKSLRLNPMLLREMNSIQEKPISNILIPYFNEKEQIYYVRPHKLGFSGIPSDVYQAWNLKDGPEEIVLTEGEFKAVAGMQYGFSTIAVPGISSFSEKKFPELVKMLNAHNVRKITIMFDNETKDDPAFQGRYKDNPYDRYDTQFYAYYMAQRLEKEAKEVVIATLPESWKVDGKIDIDGAAAQIKTTGEMKKVMYDAMPKDDYLRSLTVEAQQNVRRKMNQKYHRSKVKREFNRYIVTRHRGKTSFEEPISNFVIRVLATHNTLEGVKREAEFINEIGKRSDSFIISAEDMASADSFRSFALNHGDYIWRGLTEDLLTIWESEFLMMDEGRSIRESDHLGWIEREKIWLFGNVAIKEDGKEIRPDKSGIFWLEKQGVRIVPLSSGTSTKNGSVEGIPSLYLGAVDILDIRNRLSDSIGKNETAIILGWITAVAFMEEVFDLYRSFPFLFVTGRWQSGKSTVAEWVTNFFGIEEAGKAISQTTPVAIQRALAYYSCLPVYLDEYRNTKEIVYKNGFLRNVYNRQGAGKGIKESTYGLRNAKVRGTLIVAGEETPKDGALQSRCIVVFVSQQNRRQNHFHWFMKNRAMFSGHFYNILKNRKQHLGNFLSELEEWKEFFLKEGVNDRVAINYATVVAGYTIAFGADDMSFAKWLATETLKVQIEYSEEQAVNQFLDDLMALKTRGLVDDKYWIETADRIYIYFHGLHQVWAEQFRKSRGDEAFKESSIRNYLREEKGFEAVNVPWRIKGQLKKCVVFRKSEVSSDILNLIDSGSLPL